ncbi:phosphotransferase [Brachybacterium sp.]|uniref:phosphotransferase n=1 Tax=Brachybacterium sp. TaxID=1891286 RepID=UPI002ED18B77
MLSPGLSMLWESAEAGQALRERFGLTGIDGVARWLTGVLESRWDLTVLAVPRVTLSDHNAIAWVTTSTGPLIAKWSRAAPLFPRLAASTRLLGHLAQRGLPVAAPLPSHDGELRVETTGPAGPLSLAVLPEIMGNWLDVTDLAAVHAAGARLAELHDALGELDRPGGPGVRDLAPDPPAPLEDRLRQWLDHRDAGRVPAASARLAALVADLPPTTRPAQLIHGDYRAANLLVRDGSIAAILDFDEVRRDHPMADLAQAGTYLATLFRDWGPTPPPARAALRAGYDSVRPLGPSDARTLEVLSLWMAVAAIPPEDDGRWAGAVPALLP